jgi:hypothetical protein
MLCKISFRLNPMNSRTFRLLPPSRLPLALVILAACALPIFPQVHGPRHSRYPNSPSNDPQLVLPQDQAQSCFTPQSNHSGYEQYQQFDSYPQPASRGYLCINIPSGPTFVVDHLFAEADYDTATPADPEWYLDSIAGNYELQTGFAAHRVGAITGNPHYVLSEAVHLPIAGGTRITLIMHSFYVGPNNAIPETPGSASVTLIGHWE